MECSDEASENIKREESSFQSILNWQWSLQQLQSLWPLPWFFLPTWCLLPWERKSVSIENFQSFAILTLALNLKAKPTLSCQNLEKVWYKKSMLIQQVLPYNRQFPCHSFMIVPCCPAKWKSFVLCSFLLLNITFIHLVVCRDTTGCSADALRCEIPSMSLACPQLCDACDFYIDTVQKGWWEPNY